MSLNEDFQFYSDYYAFAAEAGLNRARDLYPGIAVSARLDLTTVPNRPLGDLAKASLSRNMDLSYESLWQEGNSIAPFQQAFYSLSEYILATAGQEIEDFLTAQGIQVEQTYATLANIFGEDITSANIKGS